MHESVGWIVLIVGVLLGILGTIVPGLPGALFVFLAVLLHKYLFPFELSWWTVGIVGTLGICSWLSGFLGGVVGVKLGRGTKYGMMGAAIGGFVGLLGGVVGMIVGSFVGAVVAEIYFHRIEIQRAFTSGIGAVVGFLLSLFFSFIFLALMIVTILADLMFFS